MEPVLCCFAEQGLYWERKQPLWTDVPQLLYVPSQLCPAPVAVPALQECTHPPNTHPAQVSPAVPPPPTSAPRLATQEAGTLQLPLELPVPPSHLPPAGQLPQTSLRGTTNSGTQPSQLSWWNT